MEIIKLYITPYRELFNAEGQWMAFDHKTYLFRCQLLVYISLPSKEIPLSQVKSFPVATTTTNKNIRLRIQIAYKLDKIQPPKPLRIHTFGIFHPQRTHCSQQVCIVYPSIDIINIHTSHPFVHSFIRSVSHPFIHSVSRIMGVRESESGSQSVAMRQHGM